MRAGSELRSGENRPSLLKEKDAMVVKLRLARFGQRNRPFYRIVAADSKSKRDGRHLEVVGRYNPLPHSSREVRAFGLLNHMTSCRCCFIRINLLYFKRIQLTNPFFFPLYIGRRQSETSLAQYRTHQVLDRLRRPYF